MITLPFWGAEGLWSGRGCVLDKICCILNENKCFLVRTFSAYLQASQLILGLTQLVMGFPLLMWVTLNVKKINPSEVGAVLRLSILCQCFPQDYVWSLFYIIKDKCNLHSFHCKPLQRFYIYSNHIYSCWIQSYSNNKNQRKRRQYSHTRQGSCFHCLWLGYGYTRYPPSVSKGCEWQYQYHIAYLPHTESTADCCSSPPPSHVHQQPHGQDQQGCSHRLSRKAYQLHIWSGYFHL